jgi:hypothetical protein
MTTFVKTVPTKIWDRETREWYTALVHTEVDVDIDRLLELISAKVINNKSGRCRMLNGIIKGHGHTYKPQDLGASK